MGRKRIFDEPMTAAQRQQRRRARKRRERETEFARMFAGIANPEPRPRLDKLARLCGMLGSEHPGERAAAALKASAELRRLGLTWREALGVS